MENNFLSEEEQYKKTLSKDEIKRIKDPVLQELRWKYWSLRLNKVLDPKNIPDSQLQEEIDKIDKEEQQELNEYRSKNN